MGLYRSGSQIPQKLGILLVKQEEQHLTEEQRTDILIAYHSLQVEDLKRKMMHPGQKCGKGHYQRRVSSVLGYSCKTVEIMA